MKEYRYTEESEYILNKFHNVDLRSEILIALKAEGIRECKLIKELNDGYESFEIVKIE